MSIENLEVVIIIAVLILIILGFRRSYKSNLVSKTKYPSKKLIEHKFVQNEYEEIIINLIGVKIKSENWSEIEVKNQSIEYKLNSLSDTGGNDNLRLIKKRINNVMIQIPYKQSYLNYEIKTEMETSKLKLFFEVQKETKAHVYKTNNRIKYIDLSFLR